MSNPDEFLEAQLAQYRRAYGDGDDADVDELMMRRARRWGAKLTLDGAVRTFGRLARADGEDGGNPRTGAGISFITLWFSNFINVAAAVVTARPGENREPTEYFEAQKNFLEKNRLLFTAMTVAAREYLHTRSRMRRRIESLHAAAQAAGLLITADPTDGYISSDSEEAHEKYRDEACGGEDFLDDGYVNVTEAERKSVWTRIETVRDELLAAKKKEEEEEKGEQEEEQEEEEVPPTPPTPPTPPMPRTPEATQPTQQDLDEMPNTPPALLRTSRRLEFDEAE